MQNLVSLENVDIVSIRSFKIMLARILEVSWMSKVYLDSNFRAKMDMNKNLFREYQFLYYVGRPLNKINKANPLGYHYSYSGKYEEMKAKFSPSFLFSLLTYLHLCFVDHQIAHIVKPPIQKHLFLDRKLVSVY